MAYWFYYNVDGQKQGAVTEEQLKEFATNGKITPGTMLEHQSGDKTVAGEVKWLTFGEKTPLQMSPPPCAPINQMIPQSATVPSGDGTEKTAKGFAEKNARCRQRYAGFGERNHRRLLLLWLSCCHSVCPVCDNC